MNSLEPKPLISVIIPIYNRAHLIERALNSVFDQTYENIEVIIVDDGSADDLTKVLTLYKNIHYFFQENKGVSAARNLGLKKANGKYIALLDSDDEWHPSKLQKQIDFLKDNPHLRWVHTEEIWIRNGVRVNQMKKHQKGGGDQFKRSLELCVISPSSVLFEKDMVLGEDGFDENFIVCEDYFLWLKLTSLYEIGFLETPLIKKYGGHEDQLSRKYVAMDYYRIKAIDWVLSNRDLADEKKAFAKSILSKKATNLLKGYEKHNNMDHYLEIKTILDRYIS